jgi:hypothetical protein
MKHLTTINEYQGSVDNYILYHFKANEYNEEYSVMAISPDQALDFLKTKMATDEENGVSTYGSWELWKESTLDNLPRKYTIEEYRVGEILHTEVS